jgi:hypothetical protein
MLSKRADVAYVRETQIRRNEDYGDYAERLKNKQSASEETGPAELDLDALMNDESTVSEEETSVSPETDISIEE